MPTVFRHGPFRFFFYAGDRDEPQHVHVERDEKQAKFWLRPVRLQWSKGFNRKELNRLQRVIEFNEEALQRKWDEYFNDERPGASPGSADLR